MKEHPCSRAMVTRSQHWTLKSGKIVQPAELMKFPCPFSSVVSRNVLGLDLNAIEAVVFSLCPPTPWGSPEEMLVKVGRDTGVTGSWPCAQFILTLVCYAYSNSP